MRNSVQKPAKVHSEAMEETDSNSVFGPRVNRNHSRRVSLTELKEAFQEVMKQ